MKHIILIGFMGSGKTTVGKLLAESRDFIFTDTDERIVEKTGREISTIFAQEGEAAFRDMETAELKSLLDQKQRLVISVGGGLPMRRENQSLLKELGIVVYLRASADTLVKRLAGDTTRPLLQGGELKEKITGLLRVRSATYEQLADVILDTDADTPAEVLKKVVEKTEKLL